MDLIDEAFRHMKALGFEDLMKSPGSSDARIDLDARGGAARVEPAGITTALADLYQLNGATGNGSEVLVYSTVPFSKAVKDFADSRQIALFKFTSLDEIHPESLAAERLACFGWLSSGPTLETEARKSLLVAIESYLQSVIDVGDQFAMSAEQAVADLIEENDGQIDEDLQSRIAFVSEKSKHLAELLGSFDGTNDYVMTDLIHKIEQCETLINTLAEKLEMDYTELESDAFLRTYLHGKM